MTTDELDALEKRLRDLTDEVFGDLHPHSNYGREIVAAADALASLRRQLAEKEEELAFQKHDFTNWLKIFDRRGAELAAKDAEIERLTRDRDYWQNIRALPAEAELATAERQERGSERPLLIRSADKAAFLRPHSLHCPCRHARTTRRNDGAGNLRRTRECELAIRRPRVALIAQERKT
jgi:hypothetical protein